MTDVCIIVYTNYYTCEWQDEPDTEILGVAISEKVAKAWMKEHIKTIPYNMEWINYRIHTLITGPDGVVGAI